MVAQIQVKRNLSDAMLDALAAEVLCKQLQGVIDADRAFALVERLIDATPLWAEPPWTDEHDKIAALAKLSDVINCQCCKGTGITTVKVDDSDRAYVSPAESRQVCPCCGG